MSQELKKPSVEEEIDAKKADDVGVKKSEDVGVKKSEEVGVKKSDDVGVKGSGETGVKLSSQHSQPLKDTSKEDAEATVTIGNEEDKLHLGEFEATELAAENPAADPRNMRRIVAEDPEWSLATVSFLSQLGVSHIVANFADNASIIRNLLPTQKDAVLKKLPSTIPIKVTANLITDENYWQRCCRARWALCNVGAHNFSWKEMYFERNLEEIIEHFVPEKTDPTELNETLQLSANHVQKLNIKQLLPPVRETPREIEFGDTSDAGSDAGEEAEVDHFNFQALFQNLPNLKELSVVFGMRDCGMNFEWNLFQFTNRDCLYLAQCLARCSTIEMFRLHRSKVTDDKIRVLISHILDHPSLLHLDVSHNLIGDRGARALGKFLNDHSRLTCLTVCNNQIHTKGAHAIAHALTKNQTLLKLNLRLNRLGDDGGQAIGRSLLKNTTLEELNLASNDLSEPSCATFSQVFQLNAVLQRIDLSSNPLGQDGGKQLHEGLEHNSTITDLDLRLTECGQESEYCINQILEKNKNAGRFKQTTKSNRNSATSPSKTTVSIKTPDELSRKSFAF